MPERRKQYTAAFKAAIVLQALQGAASAAQIAEIYGLHQTMVSAWKRRAIAAIERVFERRTDAGTNARRVPVRKASRRLRKLESERDFMAQAVRRVPRRRNMVQPDSKSVPISRQCALLAISRSAIYRKPVAESAENKALSQLILDMHQTAPFLGARRLCWYLRRSGYQVGRKRVRRLMAHLGVAARHPRPSTSVPHPGHRIYPYLLRGVPIVRPNHVWCADITYIPLHRSRVYLVAILDWATRRVLAWRISPTMMSAFCVEALQDCLRQFRAPVIFNTDQGQQFTSGSFTNVLSNAGIAISMDGRGQWRDNVLIERFWRSLKYECVYFQPAAHRAQMTEAIRQWMGFYNTMRPHTALHGSTPNEAYLSIKARPN